MSSLTPASLTPASSNNPTAALNSVGGAHPAAKSATSGTSTATPGSSSLASESTFLTLLVAQLQNQDPSKPADGMQFVTQLAQFTTLEQNLAMRTDLDNINKNTAAAAAVATINPQQPAVTGA